MTADQQRGNQEPEPVDIIAVYRNDIELAEAEYLESLPDRDMIFSKSNIFLGLLERIYQEVISKHLIDAKSYNHDYDMLDRIFFQIYLPTVYKYGYTPTLYMYASFVHMDYSLISDILAGHYRDGAQVKRSTSDTVSKWYDACRSATFTRAIDGNSIGAIFASKAAYGMTDQPQPAPMAIKEDPLPPVEEVEARYLQPPRID